MNRPAPVVSTLLRNLFLPAVFLMLLAVQNFAKTNLLDQDGGTGIFTSLQQACLTTNASAGDTVLIIGTDIDTYTGDMTNAHQTNITIIGASSNPDSFPVLTLNWDTWWANNSGKIRFERVRFNNCQSIKLGVIAGKYFVADRCVFENFNSSIFIIENSRLDDSLLVITNSIFVKNNNNVFPDIYTHTGSPDGPYGIVNNCTFYLNNYVNNHRLDSDAAGDISKRRFILISNSIFSRSNNIKADAQITRYYTNCLVPNTEPQGDWGAGCIFPDSPYFINIADPPPLTNFKPKSNSPAINKALTNGTKYDIGGRQRFSPDIGAWEYVEPPYNITLSASSIAENTPLNTTIATITVLDSNDVGSHILKLGGTDSSAFAISGNLLVTNQLFNYESDSSYTIIIRATDSNSLSYHKTFPITITNVNDPPSAIILTRSTFPENAPVGTVVCTLRTIDEDAGDYHAKTLVSGGPDNDSFEIIGPTLRTKIVADYETKKSYIINLRSSDGTASVQRLCTLFVSNVNEPHTGITLSNSGILEKRPIGTLIGRFSIVDVDDPASQVVYSKVTGTGSTDNGSFIIQGDSLLAGISFDYQAKSQYSIRVRARDADNNDATQQFTINIGALPRITAEPVSKTVGVNKSTSFSVAASGPGTLTYRWFRTGVTSEQGTSAQLILANVPQSLDKETFFCIVSNQFGSDTSLLCTLTVVAFPVITVQPADTLTAENKSISFSISAAGLNLKYKWVRNGKDTLASTGNTVTLTNVTSPDSGDSIWCVVSNEAGSVRSSTARIHVLRLPDITTEPVDQSVLEGDSAHFSLLAAGAPPLTYKWFRDGIQIGISSPRLDLPPVSITDSNSQFFCVVTNSHGSDTSRTVTLKVLTSKPEITVQPRALSLSVNDTGFFFIKARGTPPIKYSWFRVGLAAPIDTLDTLILSDMKSELDSGALYFCEVSNPKGSVFSDTVMLHVGLLKPEFTLHPPHALTIYTGSNYSIAVAAIGTKPLTFTWKKIGDSLFSYQNHTLTIDTAAASDNGHYFCIAENDLGEAISDTLQLNVVDPPSAPAITIKPLSSEITVGDSAVFSIDASGNPAPQYQWYWKGSPVSGAQSKTLVLKSVTDTLSDLFCIVSNSISTISSDTVSLRVIFKPTARFTAAPVSGPESTLVAFTNQSSGPAKSYTWFFGDGQTSTEKDPVHLYTQAGIYPVSLKAAGDDGTQSDSITKPDFITIYPRSGNPVKLSAQYLSGRNIAVTYSNLSEVDTSSPLPYADSIGLWFASGAIPSLTNRAFLVYPKSIFSSPSGIYRDTFALPGEDTLIGLITGLFYNDEQIRGTDSINGTYVFLKDTTTPSNPLTAQSTYLGGDSVRFSIYHIDKIDASISDSVFITYSPDSLFQSGLSITKYGISDILALLTENVPFTVILRNPLFLTENAKFHFFLSVQGKNGRVAPSKVSSFYTAGSNEINPISLQANPLSPSSIQLYWRKVTDPAVTDIRIFYSINEIPVGMVYPVFPMDTIKPRTSDTIYIVSALNSSTMYYFGAQVRKRNANNTYTWSPITTQSLVNISTHAPSVEDVIENSVSIIDVSFSNNSQINLNWCITDSAIGITDLEIGITSSNEQFPVLIYDPQIISVLERCSFSTVRTRQSILFDTTYYISLWLRKKNGPWADPTENSRIFFRTPKFTRQSVSLFEEGVDTVSINNNSILFWRDKARSYDNVIYDTVQAFNTTTQFPGMVPAGQGIEFVKRQTPIPFFMGLRYTCPAPFTDKDVQLYRYSNGALYVIPDSKIDALNKIISFYVRDLSDPVIPLIDTLPPAITVLSDTTSSWQPNIAYADSISISDNIANPQVLHFYCRGDTVIDEARSDKSVVSNGSIIVLDIPASVITTTAGVRASIKVSDGRSSKIVNTSRSVYRAQSDEGVVPKLKWRPISVTAELDDKASQQLFPYFKKNPTDSAFYDRRRLLMFRWQPTDYNKSRPDYKWVEYSDSTAPYFSFNPGALIWLKASDQHAYHFSSGKTLSLKDTFEMTLPPGEWTDMGLPYKFSTSINQIISISPEAENLHFYQWSADTAGFFRASLMYAKGLPTPSMLMLKDSSFTIYNSTPSPVTIRIPPIPAQFAEQPAIQKAKADNSWWSALKTHLKDNTALPDIYCGFSVEKEQPCRYPLSPTFGLSKVKLYDSKDNCAFGHFVDAITSEGISKEVVFENTEETPVTFFYTLEKIGNMPENYTTSIYNPTTSEWQTKGSVTVGPHSSEYRWFVTGTADFITLFNNKANAFRFRLHPVYPNPARGFATIRYSIPLSSREKLTFSIYNPMGRLVWKKQISEQLDAGEHKLIWTGTNLAGQKITSGMYIIVFSVLDDKGSVKYKFDSRLTFFR